MHMVDGRKLYYSEFRQINKFLHTVISQMESIASILVNEVAVMTVNMALPPPLCTLPLASTNEPNEGALMQQLWM